MKHSHFKVEDAGRILLFVTIAGFAILFRASDHAWNFTPVAAAGLFAGYLFRSRGRAYMALLAMMLVSDAIIGYESVAMRMVVYSALLLPVLLGSMTRGTAGLNMGMRLTGSSLLSSTFFYLSTNLAVWAFSGMYEHSTNGLFLCYTYALPFFRNMLMGDLFFTGAFFGLYAIARYTVRCPVTSAA